MPYVVMVDENFHYMDKEYRFNDGNFESAEAAVEHCRALIDDFLQSNHVPDATAEGLYLQYTTFGEDPFIVCDGVPNVRFSAWDYAKARCQEICREPAPRLAPPARPAGMG